MLHFYSRLIISIFFCISLSYAEEQGVLYSAVQDLLQKEITDERVTVGIEFNSPSKVAEIDSKVDNIKDMTLAKFDPNLSIFVVKVIFNNGLLESLSGKYFSLIEVPVAAKFIKFNDLVEESDVTTVKMRADRVKKGYATDVAEVINMKAKRYIAAGTMFKTSDLSSPPVIKVNDPVNIVYSTGVISLKTVGTALGAGSLGENIKVKNDASGAVILGEIINKNTVKVGGD